MKLSIFAALFLASASTSFAQDNPSYEDTVGYILDRTNQSYPTWRQSIQFPENCVLRYRSIYPDDPWLNVSTLDLGDLDPATVQSRNSKNDIFLIGRERREVIHFRNSNGSQGTKSNLQIFVRDGAEATRVGRAFQNLIRLCGGKEELF